MLDTRKEIAAQEKEDGLKGYFNEVTCKTFSGKALQPFPTVEGFPPSPLPLGLKRCGQERRKKRVKNKSLRKNKIKKERDGEEKVKDQIDDPGIFPKSEPSSSKGWFGPGLGIHLLLKGITDISGLSPWNRITERSYLAFTSQGNLPLSTSDSQRGPICDGIANIFIASKIALKL